MSVPAEIHPRYVLIAIIGLVCTAALAIAPPVAAQTTSGTITGTITKGSTPLSDITVEIYNTLQVKVATATTDVSGAYVVNLAAAAYYARTRNTQGFVDELYDNVAVSSVGAISFYPGKQIFLAAGQTQVVNFDLGSHIRGHIRRLEDGAPIAQIPVLIYRGTSQTPLAETFTDALGNYAVSLDSGTYTVRASGTHFSIDERYAYQDKLFDDLPWWDGRSAADGTPVTVTAGTDAVADFELSKGTGISGDMRPFRRDAERGYVYLASVAIYDSQGRLVADVDAAEGGTYSGSYLARLAPGNYYAVAFPPQSMGYFAEVYDDIHCFSSLCVPTAGVPIVVSNNRTTYINFDFERPATISGSARPNVSLDLVTADNIQVRDTTTDSSGSYTFSSLLAGTYYVLTTSSEGFINEVYDNVSCPGACTGNELLRATPITVGFGENRSGISFSLAPGGRISGRITDRATGSPPLSPITVYIYDLNARLVSSAVTKADGTYLNRSGLPTGRYVVQTFSNGRYRDEFYDDRPCGNACNPETPGVTLVNVTVPQTTPNVDFALDALPPEPTGKVAGVVKDTAGVPVKGAIVVTNVATGETLSGAIYTDGHYEITVPAGSYFVLAEPRLHISEVYDDVRCVGCDVSTGTPVVVTGGQTTGGIDFVVEMGGAISGDVDLENIPVEVYNLEGKLVRRVRSSVSGYAADPGGLYTLGGLTTGAYYLYVPTTSEHLGQLYNGIDCPTNCNVTTGSPVNVRLGETRSGIDFRLTRKGQIDGLVTDASTGTPLPDVALSAYTADDVLVGAASTASTGRYGILNLLPGTYVVRTTSSGRYARSERTAVVRAATLTTVDMALSKGARVSGSIATRDGGAPLAGVRVAVYDSSRAEVASGMSNGAGAFTTQPALPAGSYWVTTRNSAGYVDQIYATNAAGEVTSRDCVACDLASGTALVLNAGEDHAGLNFTMRRGGKIAGQVRRGDGTALPHVTVSIVDSANRLVTSVITNVAGEYESDRGLLSASYYVATTNAYGLVDEVYDDVPCGRPCDVTAGSPIAVVEGVTTPGIDFVLDAGGQVAGTIRARATGEPLSHVTVHVVLVGTALSSSATTDLMGRYQTGAGLPLGRYYAVIDLDSASALGFVGERSSEFVVLPTHTTTVDFNLAKGGYISGVVTKPDGSPLAGVKVAAYSGDLIMGEGTTGIDGAYVVRDRAGGGLPAGAYFVRTWDSLLQVDELYDDIPCLNCNVTTGSPVTVQDQATTSGVNFVLESGGGLSGLTPPVWGGTVEVYSRDGALLKSARIASDGHWQAGGLPAAEQAYYVRTRDLFGDYAYIDQLFLYVDCAYDSNCPLTSGIPLSVHAGQIGTGIDFHPSRGYTISGRVTTQDLSSIRGAVVTIYDGKGRVATTGTMTSAGYRTNQAVPAGTYYAHASAPGYLPEIYSETSCFPSCVVTSGRPIVVTAGGPDVSNINFSLAPGGRISGTVIESAAPNAPIANVSLQVYSADGKTLVGSATTDGRGQYGVTLTTGTYLVRTANTLGFVDEAYDDVTCTGDIALCQANAVTVVDGVTTVNINFSLTTGARISGRVTDASSGAPITAMVLLFDADGRRLPGTATTASDGSYLLPQGLPDGTYFVATQNGMDYVDEAYSDHACPQTRCDVRRSTGVTISGGRSVSAIDFGLAKGGTISGRVTTGRDGSSIDLPNVRVNVYGSTGLLMASAVSADNGAYKASGLPAGSYFLKTSNLLGYVDELYIDIACVSCMVTTGTPVTVAAGMLTTADVELAAGGLLIGTVFDGTTGQPLPDAGVAITILNADGSVGVVARMRTDSHGVYGVSLPAGTYYVQTDAIDGYATSIYRAPSGSDRSTSVACPQGICNPDQGTAIVLASGETATHIDLGLSACPSLVLSPTRLPVGSTGAEYSQTVTASGGAPPYAFHVTTGELPPGLTLDTTGGTITGTSAAVGDTLFTIAATDANGCSGSRAYNPLFCSIDLDGTATAVGPDGGSGIVGIVAGVADCPWAAASDASWLTVDPPQGVGSAALAYTYEARGAFSQPRSGTIDIGRHSFQVTQSGIVADYLVTPSTAAVGPAAAIVRADITTNAPDAPWSITTDATWIEPAVDAGTGSSTVAFQVHRNPTRAARHATVAIAGRPLTIAQRENGIPGLVEAFDAQVFGGLARFRWTPPQRGGDATSYRFEAGLAPGAAVTTMVTPSPSLDVAGPVPPGRYYVRVRGQNEFGTGNPSDEYELIVGEDGTNPPGSPRNLVAATSAARTTVTWDPPATGGIPSSYVLEVGKAPGAGDVGELRVASRYLVYDNVPPGYYFVRVRGINRAGLGEASEELLVRLGDVPSPPDAPLTLSAAVTGQTVTLTAAPPATGPAVTGYRLEVGFMRGHTDLVLASDASATAMTLINVPSGTYYVRLRATNAQGAGLASNEVRIDIP